MSIPTTQHDFLFQGRMNVNYHEELEIFYSRFLNWSAFSSVVFSSAAFAVFSDKTLALFSIPNDVIAAVLAFTVAVLNGSILAFGMMQKMILHGELKKKWIDFMSLAHNVNEVEDAGMTKVADAFFRLNAEEPSPNNKRLDRAYDKTLINFGLDAPSKPVQR